MPEKEKVKGPASYLGHGHANALVAYLRSQEEA